jgi:hypothetical protein
MAPRLLLRCELHRMALIALRRKFWLLWGLGPAVRIWLEVVAEHISITVHIQPVDALVVLLLNPMRPGGVNSSSTSRDFFMSSSSFFGIRLVPRTSPVVVRRRLSRFRLGIESDCVSSRFGCTGLRFITFLRSRSEAKLLIFLSPVRSSFIATNCTADSSLLSPGSMRDKTAACAARLSEADVLFALTPATWQTLAGIDI